MSPARHPTFYQSYAERAEQTNTPPLATYLLRLIHYKRTNLCVSADVTTTSELLQLAEDVGDHICVLKTHADIVGDFGDRTIKGLRDVARRRQFLVFEDRKFGDIGSTVQQQYTGGPLTIVRWAPIINAHIFPGPAIITALSQAARQAIAAYNTAVHTEITGPSPAPSIAGSSEEQDDSSAPETDGATDDDDEKDEEDEDEPETNDDRKGRKQSVVSVSTTISTKTEAISPQPTLRPQNSQGSSRESEESSDEEEDYEAQLEQLGPPPFLRSLLLLAQMSSADNLLTPQYTTSCVKHARAHKDFVMGFIAQQSLNSEQDDNFITMTPGVQLAAGGDGLGQQYNTPRKVIAEGGTDVIIVGRGILGAQDRRKMALDYRKQGWTAYEERLKSGRKRR